MPFGGYCSIPAVNSFSKQSKLDWRYWESRLAINNPLTPQKEKALEESQAYELRRSSLPWWGCCS